MSASLTHLARTPLAFLPTPFHPLDRLSEAIGHDGPRLFMKRDDQTGLASGGNKARKLEYLVAEAQKLGADTLITAGAVQSNHARQTAAAARACGMQAELVLSADVRDADYATSGNRLLDAVLGARIHLVDFARTPPGEAMQQVAAEVVARGGKPYIVAVGGSSPLGAVGYAACIGEILGGSLKPDVIVHASGSGGTQAGLLAGLAAAHHDVETEVLGFSVAQSASSLCELVHALANETVSMIVDDVDVPLSMVHVDDGFVGPKYGEPTPAMIEAVELVARTEGILLDPVYTGKAMAGLIAGLREGRFDATDSVVFLHTGGSAALSAYRGSFLEAAA